MVEQNYYQVLQVFIQLGANIDVKSREKLDEKNKKVAPETLLQIAYKKNYPDTIKVLLKQIDKHSKLLKKSMQISEMFYSDIFLKDDQMLKPVCPILLLQPQCLIPWDMQNALIYNFEKLLKKDKTMACDHYDLVYGSFIPDIDYKAGEPIVEIIQLFEKWTDKFPETFKLCSANKIGCFDSIFLSKFSGFRRKIYDFKRTNPGLLQNGLDKAFQIDEYMVDVEDLKNVYLILNKI